MHVKLSRTRSVECGSDFFFHRKKSKKIMVVACKQTKVYLIILYIDNYYHVQMDDTKLKRNSTLRIKEEH